MYGPIANIAFQAEICVLQIHILKTLRIDDPVQSTLVVYHLFLAY